MRSVFTTPPSTREAVIGRMCIAAVALLFLILTILQSMPSITKVKETLDSGATVGQERTAITTPYRERRTEIYFDRLPSEVPRD